MLKKLFFTLGLSLSFMSPILVSAQDPGVVTKKDAVDPTFNSKLDAALQKAEADVQKAYVRATTHENIPTWDSKVFLENAAIQLEVKKTLVNNFKGTVSLQSAAVRAKLLEVLDKSIITQADLAELQSLVNQEKERLNTTK